MKKIIVFVTTIAISSFATATFSLGNVAEQQGYTDKSVGPAKVGVVGTARGKIYRAQSGNTLPQKIMEYKSKAQPAE